jgi:hypothetical protein
MTAFFVCQIVDRFVVTWVFPINVQCYISIAEQDHCNNEDSILRSGVVVGTPTISMSSARGSVAHFYKLEILDRVQ